MLNNITFTGREGFISQTAQKVKAKAPKLTFINSGMDLADTKNAKVAAIRLQRAKRFEQNANQGAITNPADRYTSPFMPTGLSASSAPKTSEAKHFDMYY